MFKKRFIDLCNQRNVSPSSVCRVIGIAPATFSCWTETSVPRRATLQKLADYFNVSVDYLLDKEDVVLAQSVDLLLKRVSELAAIRGESLHAAFINSGVGKNFKSNLKISNPSIGKLTMLANYFGVSTDYLLGKEECDSAVFWSNFISLCTRKGVSPNTVCSTLGLSNATATKWKKGAIPRQSTLKMIADYFGVSTKLLFVRENNSFMQFSHNSLPISAALSLKELELLERLRRFDETPIQEVIDYLDFLYQKRNK